MKKKIKNETVFLNFRLVYIVFILLYSIARQIIVPTQSIFMHGAFNIVTVLVAGVIFVWDFLFFKNLFKSKYIWWLVALFAATGISIAINFRYALIDNIKAAANMFIQFFVLFAVGNRITKERIKYDIKVIGNLLSIFWLPGIVASLIMYFFDIQYQQTSYIWGGAKAGNQGFVRVDDGAVVNRLWGVFVDPNFAAAIAIMVICFSIYIIKNANKKWVKCLHIINVFLQFLYIVLSNSRTAILIVLLLAVVGGWYISIEKVSKLVKKRLVCEAVALMLSGVIAVGSWLCLTGARKVLPYVQFIQSESLVDYSKDDFNSDGINGDDNKDADTDGQPDTNKDKNDNKNGIVSFERDDIKKKGDVSNGRLELWYEGFKIIKNKPVFGVGPRSYHQVAAEMDSPMIISERSIHNSYLELFMGNGIIGIILMVIFFLLCATNALLLRIKKTDSLFTVGILMLIVLSALIGGMMISSLFYYLSGISIIAFSMLGYAVSYMECVKNENTHTATL